jgi:hypothetical protein
MCMAERHPHDLPPELARMREQDREALLRKLKAEGLTEEQAREHVRSELQERDWMERAELQTPGKGNSPARKEER